MGASKTYFWPHAIICSLLISYLRLNYVLLIFSCSICFIPPRTLRNTGLKEKREINEDGTSSNRFPNAHFDDSHFWMSVGLHTVDWKEVLLTTLPFLNEDQRDLILDSAGYNSINPLIIITNIRIKHDDKVALLPTEHKEFAEKVWNMAHTLSNLFLKHEAEDSFETLTPDAATSSVWEMLGEDDVQLNRFLALYDKLFSDNINSLRTPFRQTSLSDRGGLTLSLPWAEGSSWRIMGSPHDNSDEQHGPWHSLDMDDGTGHCNWNKDPECVEDITSFVHSVHGGTVSTVYTKCSIVIIHPSGWHTSYYHMSQPFNYQPNDHVEAGVPIGRYAGDHATSICTGGASTGPHLHMSLYGPDGRPARLHGMYISGYKVHEGIRGYDNNCDRAYLVKNERKYCFGDYILNDSEFKHILPILALRF